MRYKYWLILFVLVLAVCAALFTLFYNEVKKDAIKNLNNHQLVIAEQTKKGIEGFFRFHTDILVKNASYKNIINLDSEGKRNMEVIYSAFSDNVAGVTRVDEKGRIEYTFPYDAKSIGRDISFQSHIREIMKTRKPVMSDVFTAVQGFRAIALHVPVFEGTTFRGTIGFLIRFENIAREYLENIRIGNDGYAWLISKEGIELYCPVPGHIGHSVFENCKDFPSIIAMAREMTLGEKGITVYEYNMVRDRKTTTKVKHAVYLPINVVNTYWSIVIATPDSEVLGAVSKFRTKLAVIFGLLLLFGIPSSYFGARAWKILAEETKRKETERALRESEERYRTLFDSSVDSIIIISQELTPIDLNPAALKLFGFSSKDEFMKRTVVSGSPEYQPDGVPSSVKAKEMINIALEKGSHVFEWTHKKVDGTEFPAVVLLSKMIVDGRVAIQSSVRDISDQKRAEERRLEMEKRVLHSQKMESLGVLAGGLAHVLNNILTVIQTNLEIAAMEIKQPSQGCTPYIKGAIDATRNAAELTDQILAYAGKSVVPMVRTIDLNAMVETGLMLCKASIPQNISLDFRRDAHLPQVTADAGQVQQAIVNLVTNAAEAIGQTEGSIIVGTGIEDYDALRLEESRINERPDPGRFIFFEVSDTGCGMDASAQQLMFDPFYTTKFTGRGLGVPAVLGIIRRHRGAIFVRSTPGLGTTVRVLLPLVEHGQDMAGI